jgi:glycosidase
VKAAARPAAIAAIALAALAGAAPAAPAAAPAPASEAGRTCRADPLGGRALYLRGTMNSWNADERQRFGWACDRFVLVTALRGGEHVFKIADEAWSADANLGGRPDRVSDAGAAVGAVGAALPLTPRGGELRHRFGAGTFRFTVTMDPNTLPRLRLDGCPDAAPFGEERLFLRGTMNNHAALDDFAFRYSCDAYYLNVKLSGRHEFKVADAAFTPARTVGSGTAGGLQLGGGQVAMHFDGTEQTLRLAILGGMPVLSLGPRCFADPQAATVGDPVAASLGFDSRSLAHKAPFGAVPEGTTVNYAVTALPGVQRLVLVVETRRLEGNQEVLEYRPLARVPMVKDAAAGAGRDTWRASFRFERAAIHGLWFEAEVGGQRYALQNNAESIYWTREKGAGGVGSVAALPAALGGLRRYRQTVHRADFRVPEWAPDVVWYYVFPERYRNGDRTNDPVPGRDRYQRHTVERHANWNERPFRPSSGDGSDAVFNNDFFGGDLEGLIQGLPDMRDLGVNAIYTTPLFRAASNHKYDTADYRTIDPAFGTDEDFSRLTREAARHGIRVVPDTSLNHVGSDSLYFDRYGHFGGRGAFANGRINPASPWASWFTFDTTQADPDKQFKGWVGITDLPELDKKSESFRDFAYRAPDSVMKRWLDRGAAGWRMDVAPWVPDDFWAEWRAAIKAHKPDAFLIAETWFEAAKYFLGDSFDSTMNYVFRNAVLDHAAGGSAKPLVANLELLRENTPRPAHEALMNLLSTHDQPRSLHVLGHEGAATPAAKVAEAKRRYRFALFWQMTYPGNPAIYYGDEVGVTGGEDPDNRATYPWPHEGGQPDLDLRAHVKRLVALRHAQPVLRRGALHAPLHVDDHVVVLLRELPGAEGTTWAVVASSNHASEAKTVEVALPAAAAGAAGWSLAWAGEPATGRVQAVAPGRLRLVVPPLQGTVAVATVRR